METHQVPGFYQVLGKVVDLVPLILVATVDIVDIQSSLMQYMFGITHKVFICNIILYQLRTNKLKMILVTFSLNTTNNN